MKCFEKVIGYEKEKRQLIQVIDMIKNPEIYTELGAKIPKGILLFGDPGLGKTLMAEQFIEASELPAFICRKTQSDGKFVDQIVECFKKAEEHAPAIVFLDDMDKFANEDVHHRDAEEYVTIQSCIDQVKNKNVIVLATANISQKLPGSLIRSGRFDIRINFANPKGKEAKEVISYFLQQKKIAKDMDMNLIADILCCNTCAEIESILNLAACDSAYLRKKQIDFDDIIRVYLGIYQEINVTDMEIQYNELYTENMRKRVAYHEAGHVIVRELFMPDSVTLAAIDNQIQKGITIGGRNKKDSRELYNIRHMISMAGKVATELIFKGVDMGSSSDINDINDDIEYLLEGLAIGGFDSFVSGRHSDYSDSSIQASERYKMNKMNEIYKNDCILIAHNMEFLEQVAETLFEKRYLTRTDIAEIKKNCHINMECVKMVS